MPDQTSPPDRSEVPPREMDRAMMALLLDDENQRPWTLAELGREFENEIEVADAVDRLQRAGLLHRHGELVWASRTALAADQIEA